MRRIGTMRPDRLDNRLDLGYDKAPSEGGGVPQRAAARRRATWAYVAVLLGKEVSEDVGDGATRRCPRHHL